MAAEQITQVISQFPPPPQSGVDDEVQFNLKSDAFVAHQATNYTPEVNEWADQANAVSSQVNDNAVSADADAESAGESEANAKASEAAAEAAKNYLEGNGYAFKNRIVNGNFVIEQGDWDRVAKGNGVDIADLFEYWNGDQNNDGEVTLDLVSLSNGQNGVKCTMTHHNITTIDGNLWSAFTGTLEGYLVKDFNGEDAILSFTIETNFSGILPIVWWIRNPDDSRKYTYTTEFNVVSGINHIEKTIHFPADIIVTTDEGRGLEFMIGGNVDLGNYITPTNDLDTFIQGSDGDKVMSENTTMWTTVLGNYIIISELQFEKGSTKTAFEDLPYDVQLSRVQRYFRFLSNLTLPRVGTSIERKITLPINMREAPTVTASVNNATDFTYAQASSSAVVLKSNTVSDDSSAVDLFTINLDARL